MIFGEYQLPMIIIVGFRISAFLLGDDFFFQLGDPKKVGPVIVQNNFFEKIAQSCHILRDLF
jgi:hypothetical protein